MWKVLNEDEDMDKNPLGNIITLKENVNVYDWHAFCISINFDDLVINVVQNGKFICRKRFDAGDPAYYERYKKLLHWVYISRFEGSIADLQVFSRALTIEEMDSWTLCTNSSPVSL